MRSSCPFAQSLHYFVLTLGINRWLQPSALSVRPSCECQEHASKEEWKKEESGVQRRRRNEERGWEEENQVIKWALKILLPLPWRASTKQCARGRGHCPCGRNSASLVRGNAISLPFAISTALALETGMESYLCPVAGSCVFPMEHHEIVLLCRRCYPTHSRGHFFKILHPGMSQNE